MTTNHFKIVIPSFNNEEWLKACIKSVKRQNYQNYQCIIIDDCSTDNSCSIIDEKLKGIRILFSYEIKKKSWP